MMKKNHNQVSQKRDLRHLRENLKVNATVLSKKDILHQVYIVIFYKIYSIFTWMCNSVPGVLLYQTDKQLLNTGKHTQYIKTG